MLSQPPQSAAENTPPPPFPAPLNASPPGPWELAGRAQPVSEQWIRCKYFCDGRVNCAQDLVPADEADISCQTPATPSPPRTGGGLISGGGTRQEPGLPALPDQKDPVKAAISELGVGSMLALALLGLSLIACGILCTVKGCGPASLRGPDTVDNPNCPEQVHTVRFPELFLLVNLNPHPRINGISID